MKIGSLFSYKWDGSGEDDSQTDSEFSEDEDEPVSEDWALLVIESRFHKENIFSFLGSESQVEGYTSAESIHCEQVVVCAGFSGTQQGFLSVGTVSIILGQAFFKVKSIALDRELGKKPQTCILNCGRLLLIRQLTVILDHGL